MHASAERFIRRVCTREALAGRSVIEVGAYNVNGSSRDWLTPLGPSSYLGVDLQPQPGYVDLVLDAGSLPGPLAPADVVICAEMLEHAADWRAAVNGLKRSAKPGALLVVTARGPGFPLHGYPDDHWRFTPDDFRRIFADCSDVVIEVDEQPGVLFSGRWRGPAVDLAEIQVAPVEVPYHSDYAFQRRMATRRASPVTPGPLAAFYHVACMGNWREVFAEQLAAFRAVGLQPTACVTGTEAEFAEVADQLPSLYNGPDLLSYETPTQQRLYDWALHNPSGAVLYCHTKGVSQPQDANKVAWRRLMQRHVIERWRENLDRLAVSDAVGVGWIDCPRYPHFSGNFWMSRADWIVTLPEPDAYQSQSGPAIAGNPWRRMCAEFWIGSRPYHRIESLACRNEPLWAGRRVHELLAAS